MADLGLKTFNKLYPMMIKKYSDLIVDQNADEKDKINQIIQKLNALGKLSNDVVRDWNTVYQWTMNDGLTTDVSNKIETMKANGELDTLLQSVFVSLAGDLSTLQTAHKDTLVNAINDNVVQLTQKASVVTPMQFGAKGDGVTDDTVALQNAINYCQTNNKVLSSDEGITYGITSQLNITVPIKMDFKYSTIKALSAMTDMIYFNVTDKHSRIQNLTIDCNNLVSHSGLYGYHGKTSYFDHLRIINVTNYGIYLNADYEYFFDHIYIQGNGQPGSCGLHACGDSHFNNFLILDCYVAIITVNYSFYHEIHAWLSSAAQIQGSQFITGSGGGAFTQIYPDTYHYIFAPLSNTNIINIEGCFVFANPTIYTSTKVNQVPVFIQTSSTSYLSIFKLSNVTFIPLDTSSGLTGGGIFSNQPLYQWTGRISNTCTFTGISAVPDNITVNLTLNSSWTPVYARATKKNGRVRLEIDAQYTSGNIPLNTSINLMNFGNGQFPDGFYPRDAKKVLTMIGLQWSFKEVCYGYLNPSFDHSTLAITYSGSTTTLNYISIDIEYEAVNSI